MRALASLAVLILLAGCSAACGPNRAELEDKQKGVEAPYFSCVFTSAKRLAHTSREAADLVAIAASRACPDESLALHALYQRSFEAVYANALIETVEREAARSALEIVVTERARR
jgi:hypothetical protein